MKIWVETKKCTGCGACINICPYNAISLKGGAAVIDLDRCTYCGACVEACGFEAIFLERGAVGPVPDISAYRNLWVFAEQRGGRLAAVSLELLGEGKRLAADLGEELGAVYLGPSQEDVETLLSHGAQKVYAVVDQRLTDFQDDLYTDILVHLVNRFKPAIILAGATYIGRSFIPRVACRLQTGLTADCTGLAIDPQTKLLSQTRPTFGGNLMATILCERHRPQMATVRPRTFSAAPQENGSSGEVIAVGFDEIVATNRLRLLEIVPGTEEIDLTDAEIIVSGGRGLGKPEGFRLVQELASALGGVVGASRAAVDAGWISYPHQVGQTGKTVKPKIYIACGISGAIQHLAGMGTSDVIVAINKDPAAPIFKVAHYGLVGDLYEVLPALIKAVQTVQG